MHVPCLTLVHMQYSDFIGTQTAPLRLWLKSKARWRLHNLTFMVAEQWSPPRLRYCASAATVPCLKHNVGHRARGPPRLGERTETQSLGWSGSLYKNLPGCTNDQVYSNYIWSRSG